MSEFVYLKAGTVLHKMFSHQRGEPTITITDEMSKIRYFYDKSVNQLYVNSAIYSADPTTITAKVKKFPAISKELRASLTKNSQWEFTQDWTFSGYDTTTNEYTIPAGTVITLKYPKIRQNMFGFYSHAWQCLVVGDIPELEMFKRSRMAHANHFDDVFIPAAEAFQYLKLI